MSTIAAIQRCVDATLDGPRLAYKVEQAGKNRLRDWTTEKGVLLLVAYLVSRAARDTREIRLLKSFLPICLYCQKIRDAEGHWRRLDEYMFEHTGIRFSHGWCPDCEREHFPEFAEPS